LHEKNLRNFWFFDFLQFVNCVFFFSPLLWHFQLWYLWSPQQIIQCKTEKILIYFVPHYYFMQCTIKNPYKKIIHVNKQWSAFLFLLIQLWAKIFRFFVQFRMDGWCVDREKKFSLYPNECKGSFNTNRSIFYHYGIMVMHSFSHLYTIEE
jgi:hypothetical protein